MDKVFVIDYWGKESAASAEKQLKHAVFFKFKDDAPAEGITAVEEAFAALPEKIEAIKDFEWGINNSPENTTTVLPIASWSRLIPKRVVPRICRILITRHSSKY